MKTFEIFKEFLRLKWKEIKDFAVRDDVIATIVIISLILSAVVHIYTCFGGYISPTLYIILMMPFIVIGSTVFVIVCCVPFYCLYRFGKGIRSNWQQAKENVNKRYSR